MSKVKDIMTSQVVTVTPATEVTAAAEILLEKGFNALPVVTEAGELVGIICQSDLIAQQQDLPLPSYFAILDSLIPLGSLSKVEKAVKKIAATSVEQAMTPEPVTVTPETSVEEVANLMVKKNYHTLPVLDDGRLVGVVGKEDVLAMLLPAKSKS